MVYNLYQALLINLLLFFHPDIFIMLGFVIWRFILISIYLNISKNRQFTNLNFIHLGILFWISYTSGFIIPKENICMNGL